MMFLFVPASTKVLKVLWHCTNYDFLPGGRCSQEPFSCPVADASKPLFLPGGRCCVNVLPARWQMSFLAADIKRNDTSLPGGRCL